MATIDQQFVEFIVKTLVNNPDKVVVERQIDERGVLLLLTVDPEDIGRVIGKRGATAQSIRTLLRVLGTKNDARYNLKIVDVDGVTVGEIEGESASGTTSANTDIAGEDTESDANDSDNDSPAADVDDEETDATETELAEKTRAELADLDDLEI